MNYKYSIFYGLKYHGNKRIQNTHYKSEDNMHIHIHPFYGPLDFVRDYPDEPVELKPI